MTTTPGDEQDLTPAQRIVGPLAPHLAEITDDVLMGDVWKRPGLSPHDRSLITVAALITLGSPDQLRAHLRRARANGVTDQEIGEAITHLAFYAGWPRAMAATAVARDTLDV